MFVDLRRKDSDYGTIGIRGGVERRDAEGVKQKSTAYVENNRQYFFELQCLTRMKNISVKVFVVATAIVKY